MTERKDIAALGERTLEDLIVAPPEEVKTCLIRMTSGTSGVPIVIATGYSPEAPGEIAGDESVRRMIVCIGSRSARLSNVLIGRCGPKDTAMRVMPVDPQDLGPSLAGLLDDFKADGLHGFPAFIARLSEFMPAEAAREVRIIKVTGEVLSAERERYFAERFPNARQTEIYIASEVGGRIGNRSCRYLARNHFHPVEGVVVGIENGDEDGVGDITITKSVFRKARIERYRVGDIGRMVGGTCPCGEPVTFELMGRRGIDYIKLLGALIRREEFDRVVATFPDLIDDYRVDVREIAEDGKTRGEIVLRAFRRRGPVTEALAREMAETFSRRVFVTPTRTLAELVESGTFSPLRIVFSATPFPPGHKDVKLTLRP